MCPTQDGKFFEPFSTPLQHTPPGMLHPFCLQIESVGGPTGTSLGGVACPPLPIRLPPFVGSVAASVGTVVAVVGVVVDVVVVGATVVAATVVDVVVDVFAIGVDEVASTVVEVVVEAVAVAAVMTSHDHFSFIGSYSSGLHDDLQDAHHSFFS